MRRNWQPINLSNFVANFAIFQPNLHLKAHSYLSAAGRLHMLADCGLDCRWIDHYGLVELPPVELKIGELTNCWIRPLVKLSYGELVFVGLTNCWMKIVEYPMFNLQLVAGLVTRNRRRVGRLHSILKDRDFDTFLLAVLDWQAVIIADTKCA